MMTRLFAALVFSVAVLDAQSQPPTPGTRKSSSSQEQPQPASTQQQPAADPRGTDTAPLIVKVQPSTKTDEEAAKERAKENAEASAKRWTVGLGIATGLLGLFQLVAIGFQAWIASQQNKIIRTQNEIMDGQRQAADKQSDYMRDALAESCKASEAAKLSADAAVKSADVAERALSLTERGYLAASGFRIDPLATSETPIIRFSLHNTGRTPIWLIESGFKFLIGDDLPAPPPKYQLPFKNEGSTPIHPNIPYQRAVRLEGISHEDRLAVVETQTKQFFFWAFFKYRDSFQKPHILRFLVTIEGTSLVFDSRDGYIYAD